MFCPFLYALLSSLVTFSSVRTVSAQQEPVTAFAAASLLEALRVKENPPYAGVIRRSAGRTAG
jgi:hypothetical protein